MGRPRRGLRRLRDEERLLLGALDDEPMRCGPVGGLVLLATRLNSPVSEVARMVGVPGWFVRRLVTGPPPRYSATLRDAMLERLGSWTATCWMRLLDLPQGRTLAGLQAASWEAPLPLPCLGWRGPVGAPASLF